MSECSDGVSFVTGSQSVSEMVKKYLCQPSIHVTRGFLLTVTVCTVFLSTELKSTKLFHLITVTSKNSSCQYTHPFTPLTWWSVNFLFVLAGRVTFFLKVTSTLFILPQWCKCWASHNLLCPHTISGLFLCMSEMKQSLKKICWNLFMLVGQAYSSLKNSVCSFKTYRYFEGCIGQNFGRTLCQIQVSCFTVLCRWSGDL